MPAEASRRALLRAALAIATLRRSGAAAAAGSTSNPIKFVCAYPAGGMTDVIARVYGQAISPRIGRSIVVENRPGAGGCLAARTVKHAVPDGDTLLFANTSTFATNHLLYREPGYDTNRDFALIACVPVGHLVMAAHSSTSAATLEDFVRFARNRDVNVGSFGPGTLPHILVAQLNEQFGLAMQAVHYRGEAPMWQDLAAGSIHAAIGAYRTGKGAIDSGAARAIAVTLETRLSKLRDVPTFAEQGATAQSFRMQGFIAMAAPAGIAPGTAGRYSRLMVETSNEPRVRAAMDALGIDGNALGQEEFLGLYARDAPVWIELVRQLGLTPE